MFRHKDLHQVIDEGLCTETLLLKFLIASDVNSVQEFFYVIFRPLVFNLWLNHWFLKLKKA